MSPDFIWHNGRISSELPFDYLGHIIVSMRNHQRKMNFLMEKTKKQRMYDSSSTFWANLGALKFAYCNMKNLQINLGPAKLMK